jgi:alcohol dehydrogenase class IV
MKFHFATASRIVFGCGKSDNLGEFVAEFGSRALLVTGSISNRFPSALSSLDRAKITYEVFEIASEPTIELVLRGIERAKEIGCEMVISIGGGSVIDGGKAIAVLMVNSGDPLDYLEVIGEGKPLTHPPIPFVAIPTTAGTGSEVTRNAVLASLEHQVKVSLRSPTMLPRMALVDPLLTCSLPAELTATTGMDALTQVLEPYVSRMANPFVDIFCIEGLKRTARSLERAFRDGGDLPAREDMAFASLMGGLALANAKLGAVHGFAGPLGGSIRAPHGAICARLLPYVMEMNIRALENRSPDSECLHRYQEIGRILTRRDSSTSMDGVEWVLELSKRLDIRPLGDYGLEESMIPDLIEKASISSSMKGNPIELTVGEMQGILLKAL